MYLSKQDHKDVENKIEKAHSQIFRDIIDLDSKIEALHIDFKDVFQKSIKHLTREVKAEVMKTCSSFPLGNDQVKSLLDLKSDLAGKVAYPYQFNIAVIQLEFGKRSTKVN